jgi:hypothetical protein
MSDFAVNPKTGKREKLQGFVPIQKPANSAPDCAYCTKKGTCGGSGLRQFFVGEKYSPCNHYVDYAEERQKDYERSQRIKEAKAIAIPSPRPEGAAKDCLHCKRLGEAALLHAPNGPRQGENKTCYLYNEANIRPAGEPENCIYCLGNYLCSRYRVLRDGNPCPKYKEYSVESAERRAV